MLRRIFQQHCCRKDGTSQAKATTLGPPLRGWENQKNVNVFQNAHTRTICYSSLAESSALVKLNVRE